MTARLDGKSVVVTGATSGIGRTTAVRLHADGACVVATGRDVDRGRALVEALGDRAHFVAADLTDPAAADEVLGACVASFGAVDGVVNNAALDHTGPLGSVSMDDVRKVFEVNAFGTIAMTRAAVLAMPRDGGSIVNVTSRLAYAGVPEMAVYAASKGAVHAFTLSAAVELAPRGIRVNEVAPGMTATPLYDAWLSGSEDPERTARDVVSRIPLGRVAVPEDVAAAIVYLLSDDAAYVTGTTINVDGGYTAQ